MERKEIFITDMREIFSPDLYSREKSREKWYPFPYEAVKFSGCGLFSSTNSNVPDLVYDPKLTGYYDIYIGMYVDAGVSHIESNMYAMLSSDRAPTLIGTSCAHSGRNRIDEFLYRSADMTGESLILQYRDCFPANIVSLRFVPLTDEEYKERAEEFAPKHKKLFANNDIHNAFFSFNPQCIEDWMSIPEEYAKSDVGALSMEYLGAYSSAPMPLPAEDTMFARPGDRVFYEGLRKFIFPENPEDCIYPALIKRGKELGMEMFMSLRMGAWSFGFPSNCKNQFAEDHPEFSCYDRDGSRIARMSYAYPEVREYLYSVFKTMLSFGSDGICLLFNRAEPFVLFEEPVRKFFETKYPGIDMRQLNNNDPRVMEVRAHFMNEFMRGLRALADTFGKEKQIAAHVNVSVEACMYNGLDIKTWVEEGLINKIIITNIECSENLSDEIMCDDNPELIDLKKYEEYAVTLPYPVPNRNDWHQCIITKECIDGFKAAIGNSNVELFSHVFKNGYEAMPHKEVIRLIEAGIDHFSMWDFQGSKLSTRAWHCQSRFGHTETIKDFDLNKYSKLHHVKTVDGYRTDRYHPIWGA